MSSTLQSITLKSNIRALAYRSPLLLASSGRFIKIFHEASHLQEAKTILVGLSDTITGIRFVCDESQSVEQQYHDQHVVEGNTYKWKLVIYSARVLLHGLLVFRCCTHSNTLIHCELQEEFNINLTYCIVACHVAYDCAYILNGRNEVLVYDFSTRTIRCRVFGPQKCILYSGHLLQCAKNGLALASGTVFKQILLWAVDLKRQDNGTTFVCDIQTLCGHDGVIFGLTYNYKHNILVSASDDRSIRVWCATSAPIDPKQPFKLEYWKSNLFSLAHTYYGHSSRIWQVETMVLSRPVIISAGEDSNVKVWTLLPPYSLISRRTLFRNNRIWCLLTMGEHHVIFGGSDASLRLFSVADLLDADPYEPTRNSYSFNLPKVVTFVNLGQDAVNIFSASRCGEFFLSSQRVSLTKLSFDSSTDDCHIEDVFTDYICLKSDSTRTNLLLGSKFGHLGLVQVQQGHLKLVYLKKLFDSKVFDISFVSADQFICCLVDGQFRLLSLQPEQLQNNVCFELPPSHHRYTSCGLWADGLLIVGDQGGSVFVYDSASSKPICQYRQIHSCSGVTCLRKKPHSKLVYSAGRNGKIMEYLLKNEFDHKTNDRLELLRTFVTFAEMSWIGGFEFDHQSPFSMKYAYGFESRTMLLLNLAEGRVIFEEDCGGGHRAWDLWLCHTNHQEDKLQLQVCYTKKDKLLSVRRQLNQSSINVTSTNYSLLPRKINCCVQLYSSSSGHYMMLGGEDNYIQVLKYDIKNQFTNLAATLYGHISSVSAIKCLPTNVQKTNSPTKQYPIYVVSVGGRSQLIIWKVWWCSFQEVLIYQERVSNFLDNSFEQQKHSQEKIHSEVDVRYLDVDCHYQCDLSLLTSVVACSDGAFRIFYYCDQQNCVVKCTKLPSGTSCILQTHFTHSSARHSLLNGDSPDGVLCAVANSNGFVYFWSIYPPTGPEAVMNSAHHLHQAGINSMAFCSINETHFLMATGGDDNALKLSLISMIQNGQSPLKLCLIASWTDHSMHSCQISGLQFCANLRLVSTSIDQKLVCWQVLVSNDCNETGDWRQKLKLQMNSVNALLSSVADISSLELISQSPFSVDDQDVQQSDTYCQLLVISGEGLELVSLN